MGGGLIHALAAKGGDGACTRLGPGALDVPVVGIDRVGSDSWGGGGNEGAGHVQVCLDALVDKIGDGGGEADAGAAQLIFLLPAEEELHQQDPEDDDENQKKVPLHNIPLVISLASGRPLPGTEEKPNTGVSYRAVGQASRPNIAFFF